MARDCAYPGRRSSTVWPLKVPVSKQEASGAQDGRRFLDSQRVLIGSSRVVAIAWHGMTVSGSAASGSRPRPAVREVRLPARYACSYDCLSQAQSPVNLVDLSDAGDAELKCDLSALLKVLIGRGAEPGDGYAAGALEHLDSERHTRTSHVRFLHERNSTSWTDCQRFKTPFILWKVCRGAAEQERRPLDCGPQNFERFALSPSSTRPAHLVPAAVQPMRSNRTPPLTRAILRLRLMRFGRQGCKLGRSWESSGNAQ